MSVKERKLIILLAATLIALFAVTIFAVSHFASPAQSAQDRENPPSQSDTDAQSQQNATVDQKLQLAPEAQSQGIGDTSSMTALQMSYKIRQEMGENQIQGLLGRPDHMQHGSSNFDQSDIWYYNRSDGTLQIVFSYNMVQSFQTY